MSYTARPNFTGNQNQQQQSQQGNQSSSQSGIPNLQMMNNMVPNAQTMNPVSAGMLDHQKLLQQQQQAILNFQTQFLAQQQQQQQQQQKQQMQNPQKHHAETAQQQALNRLVSEMSKNNGNFNQQQQLQQLVQMQALNIIQQQAQVAQHVQAASAHQKTFQQQPVPLPPNTTITPVARQNMQSAPKPSTNYARPNVPQQPKPVSQSPNVSSARKNLPMTAKSTTPQMPANVSNVGSPSLNLSAVPPGRFIDLVASFSRNNQSAPATSSAPYTKMSPGSMLPKQTNVTAMNSPSMQKPNLPDSISISSAAHQPIKTSQAPSISLSVTNKPSVPTVPRNLPVSPLKLNTTTSVAGPQKLSPTSPRTKQTPRKNSNPIKTTPSPTAMPQTLSPLVTTPVDIAKTNPNLNQMVSISSTIPKTTTITPQPSNLATASNAAAKVVNAASDVKTVTSNLSLQNVALKSPVVTNPISVSKPVVTPKTEIAPAASVEKKPVAPVAVGNSANKSNPQPAEKVAEKPAINTTGKVEKKNESVKNDVKPPNQQQTTSSEPPKVNTTQPTPALAKIVEKPIVQTAKEKSTSVPTSAPSTSVATSKDSNVLKSASGITSTSTTSTASNKPIVEAKAKRNRLKTIPYQSPTPEFELVSKISAIEANNSMRNAEDKLTLFYRNEFLAVRNADGGFFLCQAINNIYKSSPKIRIRWLSEETPNQNTFCLDFYDTTDIECVLTSVSLNKQAKGKFELTKAERDRIESILKKALDVEKGIVARPDVTEENPDGLDLSLYKDESQIEKKTPSAKRKSGERATPSSAKSAKKVNKRPNSNQEGKSKQATNSLAAGKKSAVSKTSPKKNTPAKNTPVKQAPESSDKTKSSAIKSNAIESTPVAKKATSKRKLNTDDDKTSNSETDSKKDGITDTTAKDEPQAKVAKTDANEPKQESADLKSKETSASNDTAGKSTQETRSTRRTRN